MCVYVCVCMCVCVYVCMCVCVYMYVCVCMCGCLYVLICLGYRMNVLHGIGACWVIECICFTVLEPTGLQNVSLLAFRAFFESVMIHAYSLLHTHVVL